MQLAPKAGRETSMYTGPVMSSEVSLKVSRTSPETVVKTEKKPHGQTQT